MNILFVCKYNRFRSRVAEAYFKKINKNKEIKVKSTGIIKGNYPPDKAQILGAKKLGLNIEGKPQGLSTDLLKWQNTTIIVANDVPPEIFKENKKFGKKTIVWKIPDEYYGNKNHINLIIKAIIKKVDSLNNTL